MVASNKAGKYVLVFSCVFAFVIGFLGFPKDSESLDLFWNSALGCYR